METKFKVGLGAIDNNQELNTAIINGVTYEYLSDLILSVIRKYRQEIDLDAYMDEYSEILLSFYDKDYEDFAQWSVAKASNTASLMQYVVKLDNYLTEKELIAQNELVNEIHTSLTIFILNLDRIKIERELIDTADVEIKEEYIKNTLEELAVVNETKYLLMLFGADIEFSKIDDTDNKNKIIEDKLTKLNAIIDKCESIFNNDIERINDRVLSMYDRFYGVYYSSLNDGERAEKARKIMKEINPHKQLLDKLENKLTDAHELRRQLTLNKNKLSENLQAKIADGDSRVAEDSSKADIVAFELDSAKFFTDRYVSIIDSTAERLDELKEKISTRYDVLDKLEIALKTAIPPEEEMNKYSSIGFKLQELSVKMDMSRTQIQKEDKELHTLVNTAKSGIVAMISYANDIKDIYLRASMMTASFKAVNALYNFANSEDRLTEIYQMKNITNILSQYSDVYEDFSQKLVEYRKAGNNTIRDISIIMGRPINGPDLLEILDILDNGIKTLASLYEPIQEKFEKLYEILNSLYAM